MNPPIIVADREGLKLPEGVPLFYVLSSDGLYVGRNTPLFTSLVKAPRGPGGLMSLEEAGFKEGVRFDVPKMSADTFRKVWAFFREIERAHYAEAAALLVLRPNGTEIDVVVPKQTASTTDVKYEHVLPVGEIGTIVGDIHSHGNGGPTASFTDEKDELHKPGIHVIAGHVNPGKWTEKKEIELSAVWVVDGVRWKVNPADIIDMEGVTVPADVKDVPKEWIESVEIKKWGWKDKDGDSGWFKGDWLGFHGKDDKPLKERSKWRKGKDVSEVSDDWNDYYCG